MRSIIIVYLVAYIPFYSGKGIVEIIKNRTKKL